MFKIDPVPQEFHCKPQESLLRYLAGGFSLTTSHVPSATAPGTTDGFYTSGLL